MVPLYGMSGAWPVELIEDAPDADAVPRPCLEPSAETAVTRGVSVVTPLDFFAPVALADAAAEMAMVPEPRPVAMPVELMLDAALAAALPPTVFAPVALDAEDPVTEAVPLNASAGVESRPVEEMELAADTEEVPRPVFAPVEDTEPVTARDAVPPTRLEPVVLTAPLADTLAVPDAISIGSTQLTELTSIESST